MRRCLDLVVLLILVLLNDSQSKTPVEGPKAPDVIRRSMTSIKLSWEGKAPKNVSPTNWNVVMGGVSVYSGSKTVYTQMGLPKDTCFEFRLAYWHDGAWSRFGDAKYVSTTNREPLDLALLDEKGERLREMIETQATMIGMRPCALEGLQKPSYLVGDVNSIHWTGVETPLSEAGMSASALNCKLSLCNSGSAITTSAQKVQKGHMFLRLDNGKWKDRYLLLEPGKKVIEMNDPLGASIKSPISLHGCRANPLNKYAQRHTGKTGERAKGCFQLNCTMTTRPWYFCGGDGGDGTGATAARSAKEWILAINRHSHPTHVIQRYEVTARTSVVNGIIPDKLDVYRQSGWREAWQMTFLNRLGQGKTSPHFPTLFAAYKCLNLPDFYKTSTGTFLHSSSDFLFCSPSNITHSLLSHTTGSKLGLTPASTNAWEQIEAVETMKASGGSYETQWAVIEVETSSLTLHDIISSYKDYAISVPFVRGIMAQLIQALGVARKVFGFHHNDLLTTSNIRFKQIPRSEVTTHWCYQMTSSAFANNTDFSHVGDPNSVLPTTNFTIGEINIGPDPCEIKLAGKSRPKEGRDQFWSMCIPMDDVDGLMLQLYGFHTSSLVQTELAYWAKGYTFMNTPWSDDMVSVGIIMCDMMRPHVSEWPSEGDKICKKLKSGVFASNPLQALKEPFFSKFLPNATTLPKGTMDMYTYYPPPLDKEKKEGTKGKKKKSLIEKVKAANGDDDVDDDDVIGTLKSTNKDSSLASSPSSSSSSSSSSSGEEKDKVTTTAPEITTTSIDDANKSKDPCAKPRPGPPWIVSKEGDALLIEWQAQPHAELYMLLLNGVSIYSGTGTSYKAAGLNLRKCYRFQVAYYTLATTKECKDSWSELGMQLYVNDCTAVRSKLCREGGCGSSRTQVPASGSLIPSSI